MKKLSMILALGLLLACKQGSKEPPSATEPVNAAELSAESRFPQSLQKVFEAHGGLNQWREQRTLSYKIPQDGGSESHTIDLYTRMDRIQGPGYAMGYNGSNVWLDDPDNSFEGNAEFYHNLMFYFYAMPFVLADDGIQYSPADPLTFEGTAYPGIRISYDDGVGASPKDEYYLHFDPESYRMSWLGYTVTFFDDSPSEDIHWIRYDDWQDVSGLQLPASISWYNVEGRTAMDLSNTVNFEGVTLSENAEDTTYYDPPEGAILLGENPL